MEIWLSPIASESAAAATAPIPKALHLQVPEALFDLLRQSFAVSPAPGPLSSKPQRLDGARLLRVLDYIKANIGCEITLECLAEIAGYSPYHFARLFKLAMGIPPLRYVSLLRLEMSKLELAEGRLPLVEVALNAQFSSQASFTRAFHRAIGVTPKEYQRSHSR